LAGAPLDGGGLSLTGSQVDLLADGLPSVMEGRVTALHGQEIEARVVGADGAALNLHAVLDIDQNTGSVSGTLRATAGSRP
jgi:hypothetical protein